MKLDAAAINRATLEQQIYTELARVEALRATSLRQVDEFEQWLQSTEYPADANVNEIQAKIQLEQSRLLQAQRDFSIVDSLRLSASLETQLSSSKSAQERKKAAEEKLGVARTAEARSKAIFDATRRTAG